MECPKNNNGTCTFTDDPCPVDELVDALKKVTDSLVDWMEIAEKHDQRDHDYEAVAASRIIITKVEGR